MSDLKNSTESVDDALKRGVVVEKLASRNKYPRRQVPRIAKKQKRNKFISEKLENGSGQPERLVFGIKGAI